VCGSPTRRSIGHFEDGFHRQCFGCYCSSFYRPYDPTNQQCQSTEGSQLVVKIRLPSHQNHSTMLQWLHHYATASMHSVTVPACQVKYTWYSASLCGNLAAETLNMARVVKGSRSFICYLRVYPQIEWTIPAFAFPAEAGPHLPTPEGSKAELVHDTTQSDVRHEGSGLVTVRCNNGFSNKGKRMSGGNVCLKGKLSGAIVADSLNSVRTDQATPLVAWDA